MPKKILVAVAIFAIAFSAIACRRHKYHQPSTAADLAANVVDIASVALLKDDGGPKWDELDRRLDALFANNTKQADEAVVILVSFYLGEHECEEVDENLVSRGPRMIPLVERYLREEPSSLLHEYPRRVRLERETTIGHLEEDLKLLHGQSGVHQGKHWTETQDETIWQGRYGNCDHGYFVNLPPGVIGHGSHSPSPNHGILISTLNPGTTTEVTQNESRLIDVYDSSDASEIGSPEKYVQEYDLKPGSTSEKITILERRNTKFRGDKALYVHFRKSSQHLASEIEELAVYKAPKGIGPTFYVILLRTTPEFYSRDHLLYLQVREGLTFVDVPAGECSND
jgi:hypothetical protein